MWYTRVMKQYILSIALLLPAPAIAHDWNQFEWLDTLLRNHIKVVDCWGLVNDQDMETFRDECSLHTMGAVENRVAAQYDVARARHPEQSDMEFFEQHFAGEYSDEQVIAIRNNMFMVNQVVAIIVGMHIAEGLTRNDK